MHSKVIRELKHSNSNMRDKRFTSKSSLFFGTHCTFAIVKEGLQSVLRIGSAHNKGGPPNINIVQISHFSNPFLIETLVYIHL